MSPASESLFVDGDTDFPVALIGLGRRGCECVRRLRRVGLGDVHAIMIDHDPESRQEDAPPERIAWIGNVETVPDFSACAVLGVTIVGAEQRDKTEQLSFKLGLLKERPTLLPGIVLPPPAGERIRLKPELLGEMDGVAFWPDDPGRPESWALLQAAVADLVDVVSMPVLGPVEADLADLIAVFSGARSILIASATQERPADPERMMATAYVALAALNDRGFKPDRATGMLVVARGGDGAGACEGVRRLFRDILPDAAVIALAAPAGEGWRERTRVSLFAAGTFGGVGAGCGTR
ncbi:MAG: hypothetical protein RKR03_17355 [Candidatus Competibacter sp.]|nr:hypothetical protein [Candidatus Competibacter sp.]